MPSAVFFPGFSQTHPKNERIRAAYANECRSVQVVTVAEVSTRCDYYLNGRVYHGFGGRWFGESNNKALAESFRETHATYTVDVAA
jgi:hypothetical protein